MSRQRMWPTRAGVTVQHEAEIPVEELNVATFSVHLAIFWPSL
jgi:hypothetical protein